MGYEVPEPYYRFEWLLEKANVQHDVRKDFLLSLGEKEQLKLLADTAVTAITMFSDINYENTKNGAFRVSEKDAKKTFSTLISEFPEPADLMRHLSSKFQSIPVCAEIFRELLDFEALLHKRKKDRLTPKA